VKRIDANLLASLPQILQQTKKAEKIQNPAGKGWHLTIIIIITIIIPQTNFFLPAGAERRRRRRRSRGRWERRRLQQPKKNEKENQLKIFL
jgi:hypothetical protein